MRVRVFQHKSGSKSWGVIAEEKWISGLFRTRGAAAAWMQGYMQGVAYARGLNKAFDKITREQEAKT